MIRFVREDYSRLLEYMASYSMIAPAGAAEIPIKRIHRGCLGALQVWSVASEKVSGTGLRVGFANVKVDSAISAWFGEFFSDLVSAAFSSFHGLYKPAHMTLRSAVEVLVRAYAGATSEEALSTTKIYRLFEIAREEPAFAGLAEGHFNKLRSCYSELCGFTHTATQAHMAKIYAFANYPMNDPLQLARFAENFNYVVVSALSIMIVNDKSLYTLVPPRARELLEIILPAEVRLFALGN